MRISVRLHGDLRQRGASDALAVEVDEGETVAGLVSKLGFRTGEIWLAMTAGQMVAMDHLLEPGDELSLLPPVGGGC